jgi:hypothetical protein
VKFQKFRLKALRHQTTQSQKRRVQRKHMADRHADTAKVSNVKHTCQLTLKVIVQALALVAIKTEAMVSVTAKHQETMQEQIQRVAQHKATKLDLRKVKTQGICQKLRATKQCRNQLYLFHQAQIAISQTAKTQHGLMKVVEMQAERTQTRIVRTEAVAEVVKFNCHIQHLKLNKHYKNRLKSYPEFFYKL